MLTISPAIVSFRSLICSETTEAVRRKCRRADGGVYEQTLRRKPTARNITEAEVVTRALKPALKKQKYIPSLGGRPVSLRNILLYAMADKYEAL
jgi:hypothetical protein